MILGVPALVGTVPIAFCDTRSAEVVRGTEGAMVPSMALGIAEAISRLF